MEEFRTYIFKENEVKTHNARVIKERVYIIGVLVVLVGIVSSILDLPYTVYFVVAGFVLVMAGRIFLSGKEPSIGHRPVSLTLRPDSILLGTEKIRIADRKDIRITISGYAGEAFYTKTTYNTHSGNDNFLSFSYQGKTAMLQFVLDSKNHKDQLIQFCQEYGIDI